MTTIEMIEILAHIAMKVKHKNILSDPDMNNFIDAIDELRKRERSYKNETN